MVGTFWATCSRPEYNRPEVTGNPCFDFFCFSIKLFDKNSYKICVSCYLHSNRLSLLLFSFFRMGMRSRLGLTTPLVACLTSEQTRSWRSTPTTTSFAESPPSTSARADASCVLAMTTSPAMSGTSSRPNEPVSSP